MDFSRFFKKLKREDFRQRFSDPESCLEWLSSKKWQNGFTCRKCGNTNYCAGKTPYSRRCTRCKTDESATAQTIFHHCRIPLPEAFEMAWLVCNSPEISTYEIARQMDARQMTCWKFKKRITECLEKGNGLELVVPENRS